MQLLVGFSCSIRSITSHLSAHGTHTHKIPSLTLKLVFCPSSRPPPPFASWRQRQRQMRKWPNYRAKITCTGRGSRGDDGAKGWLRWEKGEKRREKKKGKGTRTAEMWLNKLSLLPSACENSYAGASWHVAGRCRRCLGAAVPTRPAATDSKASAMQHAEHCLMKKMLVKQGGRGPLQVSLKYSLSHHHHRQTTGMSVSDRLLGEQHVLWWPSVHTAHKSQQLDCIKLPPHPDTPGKSKHIP